jgi:hypothetical protein
MMKTVKCEAKEPATCRYHSQQAYVSAQKNLNAAVDKLSAAKSIVDYEQAKSNLMRATVEIDSTEVGYQNLKKAHDTIGNNGDLAGSIIMNERLLKAEENRKLAEKLETPTAKKYGEFLTTLLTKTNATVTEQESYLASAWMTYGGDDGKNVHSTPASLAQTRTALSNVRGEKDGNIRVVNLNYENTGSRSAKIVELDIKGPKDGRPLVVISSGTFTRLNVVSGNVVIVANGTHGNPITVKEKATATVLGRPNVKASVEVEAGAEAVYVPFKNSRTSIRGAGKATVAPTTFPHSTVNHTGASD